MRSEKMFYYLTLIFVIVFSLSLPIMYYGSVEEVVVTVSDKERITTGSGENLSSKYLIYTDNEVFENTDSWLFFKFSSSDLQNKLKVDSIYHVKVSGWRIPFMSTYRNIIKIKREYENIK